MSGCLVPCPRRKLRKKESNMNRETIHGTKTEQYSGTKNNRSLSKRGWRKKLSWKHVT